MIKLRNFLHNESGLNSVYYGLIASSFSILIILIMKSYSLS